MKSALVYILFCIHPALSKSLYISGLHLYVTDPDVSTRDMRKVGYSEADVVGKLKWREYIGGA